MAGRVVAGRYELVRFVGRGGMGEVWEARDRVIERRVAVKLLPHTTDDASGAELFTREARTAGALNHSGVVTVFDLGQDEADGSLFLVMEFLQGRDLASVLCEDGPPRIDVALGWAVQTAAALARAHDVGVIHRDLKPANLMLTTDGQIKILDFGIARFMEATAKSSTVMGTLAYMPPERFDGHPGDARSDLYSFGCVLNELLTGQAPFDATGPLGFMNAHLGRTPAPPSQARSGVSDDLDDLVAALLAKRPDERPASAGEVHDRLTAVRRSLSGQPAAPPHAPDRMTGPGNTVPDPAVPGSGSENRSSLPAAFARVGVPLKAHTEEVLTVAFSPDGSRLATGSADEDGLVWLWDLHTRRPVCEPLETHSDLVYSAAFSPNGSLLATTAGVYGEVVMLWDPRTGRAIGELVDHSDTASSMAFSPDGSLLAVGLEDGDVWLWDPVTRRQVRDPLTTHSSHVRTVAFSPDGSLLAVCGNAGDGVWLLDPITRRPVSDPLTDRPTADEPTAPLRTRRSLRDVLRSWASPAEPRGVTGKYMVTAFSPDGSRLATGETGGVVRLWDPITRHPVGDPMVGGTSNIFAVAFSPDGSLLASGGSDGVVRLWDPTTRYPLGELPGDSSAMAFSPDGSLLAVGTKDGSVLLYSWLAQHGRA